MYLDRFNRLSKSKNTCVKIQKLREYKSPKSGVEAADFFDERANVKTKVVKLGKNSKLREKTGIDEFVLHTLPCCGNMRSLILYDINGKEIIKDHTQMENCTKSTAEPKQNFAEIRDFINRFV